MEEKSLSGLLFTFYKILLTYFTKYWFTLKWGLHVLEMMVLQRCSALPTELTSQQGAGQYVGPK